MIKLFIISMLITLFAGCSKPPVQDYPLAIINLYGNPSEELFNKKTNAMGIEKDNGIIDVKSIADQRSQLRDQMTRNNPSEWL